MSSRVVLGLKIGRRVSIVVPQRVLNPVERFGVCSAGLALVGVGVVLREEGSGDAARISDSTNNLGRKVDTLF